MEKVGKCLRYDEKLWDITQKVKLSLPNSILFA